MDHKAPVLPIDPISRLMSIQYNNYMILKYPIILSRNSFVFDRMFSKLSHYANHNSSMFYVFWYTVILLWLPHSIISLYTYVCISTKKYSSFLSYKEPWHLFSGHQICPVVLDICCAFADVIHAITKKQRNGLQKQLGLTPNELGILTCHGRFLNAECPKIQSTYTN